MSKQRTSIPKAVSESVLKEYRHSCSMCGRHTPQLHHIDEDPSNNDPQNLIPLCPNCHLQDVHDPTSPPDRAKLRLFRKYKDPLILDPRFHPIYTRAKFLMDPQFLERPHRFEYFSQELVDFVSQLSMGDFYRKKILSYINETYSHYVVMLEDRGTVVELNAVIESAEKRQAAWKYCSECIEALLIELLRYQGWTAAPFASTSRDHLRES